MFPTSVDGAHKYMCKMCMYEKDMPNVVYYSHSFVPIDMYSANVRDNPYVWHDYALRRMYKMSPEHGRVCEHILVCDNNLREIELCMPEGADAPADKPIHNTFDVSMRIRPNV